MEIIETKIKDLLVIKPDVFMDERGSLNLTTANASWSTALT
jgi:dTDP-4-dehydrorhamnose 3,5-epimerase-like enzyme